MRMTFPVNLMRTMLRNVHGDAWLKVEREPHSIKDVSIFKGCNGWKVRKSCEVDSVRTGNTVRHAPDPPNMFSSLVSIFPRDISPDDFEEWKRLFSLSSDFLPTGRARCNGMSAEFSNGRVRMSKVNQIPTNPRDLCLIATRKG